MLVRTATVTAAALLLSTCLASSASARTVPQGFFGVDMDPWTMQRDGIDVAAELPVAAASGVESVRIPVYWFDIQPWASLSAVPAGQSSTVTPDPAGGAPFRWTQMDAFMRSASANGISVLPILMGAPAWAADSSWNGVIRKPADPDRFAQWAAAMTRRYGSGGTFWSENADLTPRPIKTWQIWNEPDIYPFWPQHRGETQTVTVNGKTKRLKDLAFAPTYVQLLRASRGAIKSVDPSARIMIGSMTNFAWSSLKLIYASGGRGTFDVMAANVFSKSPTNLPAAIRKIRGTMSANGDSRLPYSVTEYSWSSALGTISSRVHMGFLLTNQANQAKNLTAAMTGFIANRSSLKLESAYWFNWAGSDLGSDVWDYAGLRRARSGVMTSKTPLAAFKKKALAAEGCAAKIVADACRP